MNQVNFDFSLKNIPIPSQKEYLIELISSVGDFVSNFRYRVFHFLNPSNENEKKETFGLKTTKPPPSLAETRDFENALYELVKNVRFRQIKRTTLQSTLNENMRMMDRSNNIYVAADKTKNHYELSTADHDKLLEKNVTKGYKKCNRKLVQNVNKSDKAIAESLELDDRIFAFSERDAFVTIKDHKDNYQNNTQCRLINPAKSDLGKVSKKILARIVGKLREAGDFNQWKNSYSVIEWFKGLQNKAKLTFLQFDIVEFYPSITEEVLKRALNFAKDYTIITDDEIRTILDTKKALLFKDGEPWVKKGSKPFDVTMGSWDGAECADLVGLYLLSKLSGLGLDIGLYRDDGLGACSLTPRQAEMAKKKLCRIFSENGFKITVQANMKSVDFLDINLNLETGVFKPYMKPNGSPVYVHSDSNHPKTILENIPKSINRRLSSISSSKEVFEAACPPYQAALDKSGYNYKLNFDPPLAGNRGKNRKRKILYFNPPFSKNVQTNIGEKFLKLLDTHFPKENPLRKIANRNNVKISYRCMSNFKSKIAAHNSRVRRMNEPAPPPPGCNCTGIMGPCPLRGGCLESCVVYGAEVVDSSNNSETYTGLTANTFKKRFYKHRSSFMKPKLEHETTLSAHIWNLRRRNQNYSIHWNIKDKATPFNPVTRKCRLCLKEKYHIIFQPEGASLNTRSELFSTCRHRLSGLLANT